MAADSENTMSLVAVRLCPTVAHPAGLSFMAWSRRPNAPRRSTTTPKPSTANIAAMNTKYARSLLTREKRPNARVSDEKPSMPWNTTCSTNRAKAMVARAR